ncbi:MAG: MotA/TolQ/ExbB proton channel family protein, partial [Proteobacteria bacterium]|nr:MotA/TolQ/ExbB proton channel family protein [Pseudomonadota bacterium]
ASDNAKRMKFFRDNRAKQTQLLADIKRQRTQQESLSRNYENTFEDQDQVIIKMEDDLVLRLGGLKELFGVLQQSTGDAQAQFANSITEIQFPKRKAFMKDLASKMGQTNRFATLSEIEMLWFEMQREIIESGKVSSFTTNVVSADGVESPQQVIRIGAFNAVSQGKYLEYVHDTGRLVELPRQPQGRYLNRVEDLEVATGLTAIGLDPTRGGLLSKLVKAPNLMERVQQGKEVGFVIIVLGIIGLLIAIYRLFALSGISAKVNRQVKNLDKPGNNPLGRVLQVYKDKGDDDLDAMEIRIGEAILNETPALHKWLPFIKIISAVAPLLGLLGTVTGMINTFQALTLFGTGDPATMAGGISTALVTTVLGLVVAIPMLFLHSIVAGRAKAITEVLQQQAAGMIAEIAERK